MVDYGYCIQDLFDIHLNSSDPLFSSNPLDSPSPLDSSSPPDNLPVLIDPKTSTPSIATMANEHDAGKSLKRKPSLQKCVEWLTKRKSFATLVEKTAMASSHKRATSPIREHTFPCPVDASPSPTKPASPTATIPGPSRMAQPSIPSRAATPPPKIDVHISTSPIDWYSWVLPPPKPAAADTRDRGGRPLPLSISKEEVAALRGEARQNIRARAAAAIAGAAAVVALPDADWVTALAGVAAAGPATTAPASITASASTTVLASSPAAAAKFRDN